MPKSNRKERDRLLRRSDILKAAEQVFAREGYHNATIADIAKEAQYAVGTIYLYFKDKRVLYLSLFEEKAEDLILAVKNRVGRETGITSKIKAFISEQLSFFEKNASFFKIYFSEGVDYRWLVKDRIPKDTVNKYLGHLDYLAGLMKSAEDAGVIKKNIPPERVAYILVSMLNSVIFPWLKTSKKEEEGELQNMSGFIYDVFMNGVGK